MTLVLICKVFALNEAVIRTLHIVVFVIEIRLI